MHLIKAPYDTLPLHGANATRHIEATAGSDLMQRAGLATARLCLALAPHAQNIWVACGPGNNGGDGLIAAQHLQAMGKQVTVTRLGDNVPTQFDMAIDAMLGIGRQRPLQDTMLGTIRALRTAPCAVLAVDVPSGLDADSGADALPLPARGARHTLSLLTLKPGLFTHQGRDAAGNIWWDDLGCASLISLTQPDAWLNDAAPATPVRPHASHKGSYGDVAIIGGAQGMTGAALLAGRAALHAGAGRVYVAPLEPIFSHDSAVPELMLREWARMDLRNFSVVCGCGGGNAVITALPRALDQALHLVLDADGLNAVGQDIALQKRLRRRAEQQQPTVLTPHPLEAAGLLACTTVEIQAQRVQAAQRLADQYGCVVALKGSGTVLAAPGQIPRINVTGNAHLATAGTGDVLAGMIGALLAQGLDAWTAASQAVYRHGLIADKWCGDTLTASALIQKI